MILGEQYCNELEQTILEIYTIHQPYVFFNKIQHFTFRK